MFPEFVFKIHFSLYHFLIKKQSNKLLELKATENLLAKTIS